MKKLLLQVFLIFVSTISAQVGIGTTNPLSKLDVVGDVNATTGYFYGGLLSPLSQEITKTIPIAVNDFVDIGNFAIIDGAHNFRLSVTASFSGFSVSKSYIVATAYSQTDGIWQQLVPAANTGAYGSDFEIDIKALGNQTSLRIRKKIGSGTGTAQVRIENTGSVADVFTNTNTTGTATVPSAVFQASAGAEVWVNDNINSRIVIPFLSDRTTARASSLGVTVLDNGNLGVGTATPASKFDVTGEINTSNGIFYGGTSSPLSKEIIRIIPTAANNFIEIGNFFNGQGAHNFRINVTLNAGGFSVAKSYTVSSKYDQTENIWKVLNPTTSTGGDNGNDYAVDINSNGFLTSLRLRRTSGVSAGTATIRIESTGGISDIFTATAATGSTTTPNATFETITATNWSLTGNTATTPSTNFIGTTDNKDLVFRTNNLQTGRINKDGLSISLGLGAGSGNATLQSTVFIGNNAGASATNAPDSNFIGTETGWQATNATGSNFIGYQAGYLATNAYFSSFIGHKVGVSASLANNSNFIGRFAGFQAINANNSNFFGQNAGYDAAAANNSNFIGYNSGLSATSAEYSNFIGNNVGINASGANNSNFFGNGAGEEAINAKVSNFIGLLSGRAAANAEYSNFIGFNAGRNATNANNSNFIGNNAGAGAINAFYSNFFGTVAGFQATGANHSNFFGTNAGHNAVTSYNSNFFGQNAGQDATTANNSNFIGTQAGQQALSANNSNFFGNSAGSNASNANNSNFIGKESGLAASDAYNSNFFGPSSGLGATNANNSNFFGNSAGSNASNANNSNFIGKESGLNASDAYNSNFFGISSGLGATDANNANFLGNRAGSGATNANNANFFGSEAGSGAINATYSNFIGNNAGYGAKSASVSNFFGLNAGRQSENAYYSNFFGPNAGQLATNANNSNFFGSNAGRKAEKANNSIFIGNNAGYDINNDIGDPVDNSGGSTSILIGDDTSTGNKINSIAIGKSAVNTRDNQFLLGPSYINMRLRDVEYELPSIQATAGQVLSNDGNGVLTWTTPSSGSVTASNGLNVAGIDVKLGGPLSASTAITTAGNNLFAVVGSNFTNTSGLFGVSRTAGSNSAGAAINATAIASNVPLTQNVAGRFEATSSNTAVATINYGVLSSATVGGDSPAVVNVGSRNEANFNFSGGSIASLRGTENSVFLQAGSTTSAFASLNDIILNNNTSATNVIGVGTSLSKPNTVNVTRYAGFYMVDNNTTGIANRSALYLGTDATVNYTGEWGIYNAFNRNNIINGSTRIGSIVAPAERLDVTGNVRFSGALMPNGFSGTSGQVLTSTGGGGAPTWITQPIVGVQSYTSTSGSGVYNAVLSEYTIRVLNTVTGIQLPTPAGNVGKIFIILGTSGITSKTFTTASGTILDVLSATTITALNSGERYMVQSDGADWIVIGR